MRKIAIGKSIAGIFKNASALSGGTFEGDLDDIADGTTYKRVTQTEKNTWDAKSDFSGSYDDLIDKPVGGGGLTQPQIMARSLGC